MNEMNIEKAIEILEIHNKWRRDNDGKYEMVEPKELGKAIDSVVSEFKNLHLQNVSRCFSSKEQLAKHITTHIPIAIKPTKPAKTTFVTPFTSNNARQIVEDAIVECLLNNG